MHSDIRRNNIKNLPCIYATQSFPLLLFYYKLNTNYYLLLDENTESSVNITSKGWYLNPGLVPKIVFFSNFIRTLSTCQLLRVRLFIYLASSLLEQLL